MICCTAAMSIMMMSTNTQAKPRQNTQHMNMKKQAISTKQQNMRMRQKANTVLRS